MKFRRTLLRVNLVLLLLIAAPVLVQAQFEHRIDKGAVTITRYACSGSEAIIPRTISGLPVTSIGDSAFAHCSGLVRVTIPDGVTSVGTEAFFDCRSLKGVTIPNSVTSVGFGAFSACGLTSVTIGNGLTGIVAGMFSNCDSLTSVTIPDSATLIGPGAFSFCTSLTNVTIPDSVTYIGYEAFWNCANLASVTIGNGVAGIGDDTFYRCTRLTEVYFRGNAPSLGRGAFQYVTDATLYYLPGTLGWPLMVYGLPTALWRPQIQAKDASLGLPAHQFGFEIAWAKGQTVVVEACTDLLHPVWTAAGTNTLTDGSSSFSDSAWGNHPARFYRLRWP